MSFDLRTHSGIITVLNPETGDHRTFRVRRQRDDSRFMPGERLVALLTGPDNRSNYRAFGKVTSQGNVHLWRQHWDNPTYEWFKKFLENPRAYPKLEVTFEGRCLRCGRKLTTPESVKSGIGPRCREMGL
jgi:hypothetical protein